MKKFRLLDLLPQHPDAKIDNFASFDLLRRVASFFVEIADQALESFIKGSYEKFDAQVGETLCQSRAYKIYLLSSKENITEFLSELNSKRKLIQYLKKKIECNLDIKKNSIKSLKSNSSMTTNQALQELGLSIELSTDMVFIISAYFLTLFQIRNDFHIPIAIDYSTFLQISRFSKSMVKRCIHAHQKLLSKLSCDFIISLLRETNQSLISDSILENIHLVSDEGRIVLPSFVVTNTIITHLQRNSSHFVISLEQDTRPGKPIYLIKDKATPLKLVNEKSIFDKNMMKPSLIFQCITSTDIEMQYITTLKKLNLFELIVANAAIHPQYSGKKLAEMRDNPFDFLLSQNSSDIQPNERYILLQEMSKALEKHKKIADYFGVHKYNKKLFDIVHIYCSSLCQLTDIGEDSYRMDKTKLYREMSVRTAIPAISIK